jgi:orotate phosphoribosyltransferase
LTIRDELIQHIVKHSLKKGEFILASGKKSNYYINGKMSTLDARGAFLTARIFLAMMADDVPDAVGGLTIGADPIVGSMLALAGLEDLHLRGFLVRKEAKDHGTKSQVEGPLNEGDRVVIIEDVVTSGGSSMKAVNAVREMGCEVSRVLAIVDREEGARGNLAKEGITLESIFTRTELLAYE